MYLAPRYEADKLHVLADVQVIDDNNAAREAAEIELHKTKVQIQTKATEKALAFVDIITRELFGKDKEEPEKVEEPMPEKEDGEVDDLTEAEKKKEGS